MRMFSFDDRGDARPKLSSDVPLKILEDRSRLNEIAASYIRRLGESGKIRILEAGCGRKWPLELDGVSYTLTGVDLDEHALESRKVRFKDLDESVLGDLRYVSLPASSFDVIYSSFVLEHVQDAALVLGNFVRWLKPGGLMILKFPDRNSVYGFCARMTPFWVHVLYYRHVRKIREAGRPGFMPYPTFYPREIERHAFRRFAASRGLRIEEELGFLSVPPSQRNLLKILRWLSLGTLDSDHTDLFYVLRAEPAEIPRREAANPERGSAAAGAPGLKDPLRASE